MTKITEVPKTTDVNEISALIEAMASKNPVQREAARKSLIAKGHDVVVPLLQVLKSPLAHMRWEAAKTLEGIADPATALALVELLEDENADVRWVAGEALIALGHQGVSQTLLALISGAMSLSLRKGAHQVIAAYAKHHHGELFKPLLHDLQTLEGAMSTPLAAYETWKQLQQA